MTGFASWLLAAAALAVLGLYGGAGAFARPLFASAVAVSLLFAAIGMGRRFRIPAVSWLVLAFVPVAAVCAVQVIRVGWNHPWTAPDLAILGESASVWSIDPAATMLVIIWTFALIGFGLVMHCHFRGQRARVLGSALVIIAGIHAVAAIVLALIGVDWPTASRGFMVRGCFVYHNHAAAFMASCLPLAILTAKQASASRERNATPSVSEYAWWLAVAALVLAVILTASRGGIIIASAINLPLAWRTLPRRKRAIWFAALVLSIGGYLGVIGLREVGERFSRLSGPEGVTLNGRFAIWTAAMPVLAEASPIGSGGNTAERAFWRTGDTQFFGRTVNHLHCDPLEWLLEFGWVGTSLTAFGLGIIAWRWRPPSWRKNPSRPADAVIYWGGLLGLAHLFAHSCVDFIWNREAIAIAAVVLSILACEGRSPHDERPALRSGWVRATCLVLCAVIAALVPGAWRQDHEKKIARDAGEFMAARRKAGLDPSGELVDRLLALEPTAVAVATAQARAALDLSSDPARSAERLERSRLALTRAAYLAPADAGAWVERARLASRFSNDGTTTTDNGGADLPLSIARVMEWAPAWPYAQLKILECLRRSGLSTLPIEQLQSLVNRLLTLDQPQPPWFFVCAQQVIGRADLAAALAGPASDDLARSGLWWLAGFGEADQWFLRYRALHGEREVVLSPPRECLRPLLEPPLRTRMRLADEAEKRRSQAEQIEEAGLPVPVELSAALMRDGSPWKLWSQNPDTLDETVRAELTKALTPELFRPWAKTWFNRVALAERALAGKTQVLVQSSDPRLIARCAEAAGDSAEGYRLRQLLAARARPEWHAIGAGCQWTWLWVESETVSRPIARSGQWVGMVVDGAWRGWVSGTIVTGALPPGLHRIALIQAP
jgi:hypothetical protein